MAYLTVNGIGGLQLSLAELARLPNDVINDILDAEAAVVIDYQKRSITEKGLSPHGKLRESIRGKRFKAKDGTPYVDVFPQGTHHTNPGGTKVRNAEIGFIREYGAEGKGLDPTQWMRTANERAADDVEEAALEVYDNFLKEIDLL